MVTAVSRPSAKALISSEPLPILVCHSTLNGAQKETRISEASKYYSSGSVLAVPRHSAAYAKVLDGNGVVLGSGQGQVSLMRNAVAGEVLTLVLSNQRAFGTDRLAQGGDLQYGASGATLCIKEDGAIWGVGGGAALGYGNSGDRRFATKMINVTNPTQIATSGRHTIVLQADGTVRSTGINDCGQLGNNSTTQSFIPVSVQGLTDVVEIACGEKYNLALVSDGRVMAWGKNDKGQLGDDTMSNRQIPVEVSGIQHAVAVACGRSHSLALLANGTVMAWGDNTSGELGDGTTVGRKVPVAVKDLTSVISVAAGDKHSLALLADGTVMAWGRNTEGQLGLGNYVSSLTPKTVPGLTGVKDLSCVADGSLALMNDGTVKAWGANGHRDLGLAGSNIASPTTIPGLSNVVALRNGGTGEFGGAVISGGRVCGWGGNDSNQLEGDSNQQVTTPKLLSLRLTK